jgi:hypothetical protein
LRILLRSSEDETFPASQELSQEARDRYEDLVKIKDNASLHRMRAFVLDPELRKVVLLCRDLPEDIYKIREKTKSKLDPANV